MSAPSTRCRCCARKLTDAKSIAAGIGPGCSLKESPNPDPGRKLRVKQGKKPTFDSNQGLLFPIVK